MADLDVVVTGPFSFRVPLWTVAYVTPERLIQVSPVPTPDDKYGEWAFGVFTDSDQAERYRDYSNADGEHYRVSTINNPPELEIWLKLAEAGGMTHVGFDYTIDHTTGRCNGRFETIAEVRRLAKNMRHVQ